jgi:MFS family permease
MTVALQRTFASLAVPNYRRYFAAQVVSISGNWMQTVAEMWLVVQLTGSGVSVGLVAALQFLPILLAGAWGGALVDRLPRRRVLMLTQLLMALPAATLWLLTVDGSVELWMVYALVLARGMVLAVDNPARQSFVSELVGPDRLVNAVSLNSVVIHSARIVGPAAAGIVIATLGVGPCFGLNALSFGAMLVALRLMDPAQLHGARKTRGAREPGQVRAAFSHVRERPELWIPLAMMVLVGTLSFNFQVLLPLMAHSTWHGGAGTYAALTTTMGVGSVVGALLAGARGRADARVLLAASALFGVMSLAAAAAPVLWLELAALVPLGAASVTFAAGVNSALQLGADPALRGRVMALYSVVFLGSTPIGAPLAGWLAEVAGPRAGLVVGGAAAIVAAVAARAAFARAGLLAPRGAAALEAALAAAATPPLGGRTAPVVPATPPLGGPTALAVPATPPPGGPMALAVAATPPPGGPTAPVVPATPPLAAADPRPDRASRPAPTHPRRARRAGHDQPGHAGSDRRRGRTGAPR